MINIGKMGLIALMIFVFGTVWHDTPALQSQGEKEAIAKWAVGNITDLDNTYEYIVSPYGIPVFNEESVTFTEYSDGTAHLFGIVHVVDNPLAEPLPAGIRQAAFRIDITFEGRTTDLALRDSEYECPADQQNVRFYPSGEGNLGFEIANPVNAIEIPAQFGEGAFNRLGCTNMGWLSADWGVNPIDIAFTLTPIYDAQIGNRVWDDLDRNGIQDPGELGIDGVEVRLHDGDRNLLATTTTANGGLYLFDDLTAGDYEVRVISSAPLIFTARNAGDDDAKDSDVNVNGWSGSISVGQSEQNYSLDAGLVDPPTPTPIPTDTPTPTLTPTLTMTPTHVPGTIGDRTWLDENRNGLQDPDEPNVSGIIVNLLSKDSDEPLATTTSDANGNYSFSNMDPKLSYRVQFVIPEELELAFTTQNQGTDEEDSDAELTDGIIADFVTIEAGESNYTIDAGFYSIAPTVTPTPTPTDTPTPTPTPTPTHVSAQIGDFVWLDVNANGIQDEGEAGVADIIIELLPEEGDIPLALAATDANGFYEFVGLNPKTNYRIRARMPVFSNLIFSPQDQGDDQLDSDVDVETGITDFIVVTAGEAYPIIDIGIHQPIPTPTPTPTHVPGSIGDRTWLDTNRNGIQDPDESGLPGITVNLLSKESEEPLATTLSDVNGNYLFTNMDPKLSYRVQFVIPDGAELAFIIQNQGTDEEDSDAELTNGITSDFVTIGAGESDYTIDAGFYSTAPTATPTATPTDIPTSTPMPTATLPPARAGDFVWLDTNANGIQDEGEEGVADIVVELLPKDSIEPVALTATDANGFYEFSDLSLTMSYRIRVRIPGFSDLVFSPLNQGSDELNSDELDSDVDPETGITDFILVNAGQANLTIDAGMYRPGSVPTAQPSPTPTTVPEDEPTATPTPAVDPEGTLIMASSNTVGEDGRVLITLAGYNFDNLGTATIEVVYDPSILAVINCTKDPDDLFDLVQCNREYGPDRIRFNITSITGVSGDITIAELTFQALGQSGDRSDISISLPTIANAASENLIIDVMDGWILISPVRVGDVSCDGVFNAIDALFTLQYDVGLREASNSCTQPDPSQATLLITDCDVNDDGKCNAIDALFSLQCDVGIANATCPVIMR